MANRLDASARNSFIHGEPFRHSRGAVVRSGMVVSAGLGLMALGGYIKNSENARAKFLGWLLVSVGTYMVGDTAQDLYASNPLPERTPIVDPQYVFGNLENVERIIERHRRL